MKKFWKIVLGSLVGCIIALVLLLVIPISALSSVASMTQESTPVIPSDAILKIGFETAVTEIPTEKLSFNMSSMGADYGESISLYSMVKAIDIAAEDPAIKFIYMTPEMISAGISQTEEIRAALTRFRTSGKAIVSYSHQLNNHNYYIASVADKVMFNTYGDVLITGLSSNIIFFKDLLDRLDINVQLIRHGKYKAAGEQFTKNGLTEENREQNQVLLNSIWNSWCADIAASRDFSAEQFNWWLDNLTLKMPADALQCRVVDQLCYRDEVEQYLCSLADVSKPSDLKFVSIENYAKAKVKSVNRSHDKIAVVYANGEIVIDGDSETNIVALDMTRTLAQVRADSTIKAVVLRVNSPGGSAQAAEMINRELTLLKEVKPLVISFGDYAASGGYWIAAGGDKIFTDNATLTGSIGVFSIVPSFGEAIRKNLHVNPAVISTNRHGAMLSGMNEFNQEELAFMEANIERVYTDFTQIVADGRKMSVESVDEIGQGRVWAGCDALANGLADEKGGLVDAIRYAEQISGLESYNLVSFPPQKTIYEKLMESFNKTEDAIQVISDPMSLFDLTYSRLKDLTTIQYYARLPYLYDIR